MEAKLFTVEQLATALSIGKNSAYSLIRSGKIPAKKLGRKYYVKKENIDKFLAEYFAET
ncbi:helix-turn-helix domain-containing protein [Butyrivibrio sp. FCS006]|uniref:helix-turn-helix domain-containing protein n=1 Tax=Butyrivibrio sp. FCS006 TaxID=1280684 RepID=UPI0009DB9E52|nr:helix-turn-helix domain-containing protein [Butyrivibrio sp. FCS006]